MATWQHLRSSTANKRPTTSLADGRIAINTNTASPGLFFKDSAGTGIVKVGPVHVGTTAPNSTPAAGGSSGNYTGEQWLDTSVSPAQLKVWNGSAWVGVVADELPVSKLQDGDARQLLQTDAAGTGVEWTSNVDVPGTLDVTSTATFDSIARHPLGSAAAPTLTFTGDTNTGIYSPGADQVAISTNGTGRLFVTSAGWVGVGASPTYQFDISQATATDTVLAVRNSAGTYWPAYVTSTGDVITGLQTSGSVQFRTNNTERLRITSDGKLGLGSSAPQTLLQLGSTVAADQRLSIFSLTSANDDAYGSLEFRHGVQTGNINCKISALRTGGSSGGSLAFFTRTQGDTVNTDGGVERLRIDSAGRVGVGIASPTATAHIYEASTAAGSSRMLELSTASGGNFQITVSDKTSATPEWQVNTGGSEAILFSQGATERARIDSSGRLLVGTSTSVSQNIGGGTVTPQIQLAGINQNGSSLSLVNYFSSGSPANLALGSSTGGSVGVQGIVANNADLGRISFTGSDGSTLLSAASILAEVDGTPGTNDMPGRLVFSTTPDGSASPVERMRITNAGATLIGTTSPVDVTTGTQDGFTVFATGDTHISKDGSLGLWLRRRTSDGAVAAFYRDTTQVGSISVTTTATAYNTSSDYRLKENVTAVTDGITRLQQLKPSRFNFIADPDTTVDGFLAHEVQSVVPEAITGEKDAVDDEGNPEYQGIDQSKLVPLLTAALQEAIGEIESLKARVAALETP